MVHKFIIMSLLSGFILMVSNLSENDFVFSGKIINSQWQNRFIINKSFWKPPTLRLVYSVWRSVSTMERTLEGKYVNSDHLF